MATAAVGAPGTFEAFVEQHAGARFSQWLRITSEPAWTEATTHRFTEELATGAIDDAVYRRYLVQDYAFIETLVTVLGHAIAQAPTMRAKLRLARFLAAVTSEENDYFERAFDALDVPQQDRERPALARVTQQFNQVMTEAATTGGYEATLAVLTAVEWVYLTWAQRVAEAGAAPERAYLREWIELHDNPDFEAFVTWLTEELDERGPVLPAAKAGRLRALFARAVELEVAFFDEAYRT